jgi:hypothetical protein
MSSFTDPEIVFRVQKPHHAGLIVASPDAARIDALITDYTERYYRDFFATAPPPERPDRMTSRTLAHVWSPQLRNRRRVDVYLPPSYNAGRERYPVVYMQDGQNLSDPDQAFAGRGSLKRHRRPRERGIEAIVVGVHHAGERRLPSTARFPIVAMAAATATRISISSSTR